MTALHVGAALILSACNPPQTHKSNSPATASPYRPADDPLNNTLWELDFIYSHPPLEGIIPTLSFSDGFVGGSSGCNQIVSPYVEDERYKISATGDLSFRFGQTLVLCSATQGDIMEQEEAYFSALRSLTAYRLDAGNLELRDGDGNTILVFSKSSGASP